MMPISPTNQDLALAPKLVLTITEELGDGQGLAYDKQNRQIFIKDALLGEEVEVVLYGENDRYAQGRVIKVLKPSPNRIPTICDSSCGACAFKVCEYEYELNLKKEATLKLYENLKGFSSDKFIGIKEALNHLNYRNKAIYAIKTCNKEIKIGLYEKNSHNILEVQGCALEKLWMRKVLLQVKNTLQNLINQDLIAQESLASLRYLYLRGDKEKMAVIVAHKEFKELSFLLKALKAEGVDNILLNINETSGNRILGETFKVLSGKDFINTTIFGKSFKLNPNSFLQINQEQTNLLYRLAIELLNPAPYERLVDLYCGIGTISLCVHDRVQEVIGIECVKEAIVNANENKELNKIDNAQFFVGLVEEILPKIVQNGKQIDIAILDPARKGVEESVFKTLATCNTKRLVYISCNPKSQVRDLKVAFNYGFKLEKLAFVDMFPHTAHVETVVLMSRVKD